MSYKNRARLLYLIILIATWALSAGAKRGLYPTLLSLLDFGPYFMLGFWAAREMYSYERHLCVEERGSKITTNT